MVSFGRFISILIALLLIALGVVLLLGNLGLIGFDVIDLIELWPLILIAIGLYFIWLRLRPAPKPKREAHSEVLAGAKSADIDIEFGAGELRLKGLSGSPNVFEGTFLFGVDRTVRRSGDTLNVKLRRTRWSYPPFSPWPGDDWEIGLTDAVPLSLRIGTGASRVFADLTKNKAGFVELNTGASDITLLLPELAGYTRVVVKGGAASIRLEVPQGVAARVRSSSALSSLHVDERRFPKGAGEFVSVDYGAAQNKVDIEISAGVSSVTVV